VNFELQTAQKLTHTLSSEQIQHLEILQFSNQELDRYIYEKANDNPLIELVEPDLKALNRLLDVSIIQPSPTMYKSKGENTDFIQGAIAEKESVLKPLFEQIPLHQNLSPLDIKVLKYFIYNLDENFFLDLDFEETAAKFNVSENYLMDILYLLQTFEPIGVGARNRIEFLLIQVDNDLSAPPLTSKFIKYHLDKVASLSLKYLSKHYKISINETKKIVNYIRSLDPNVSTRLGGAEEGYIIPEVVVEKVHGEWIIHIPDSLLPKININEEYVLMLQSSIENADYCQKQLQDIVLLKEGIEQRNRTLYSLTRLLLTIQAEFFNYGMSALKPVRLKDVANVLELHESTISRTIRNKYIKTPHGTYAFRSLFTRGIANHSGKMDSVLYIKQRINELIASENHDNPLTDQDLTSTFQNEGIQISRRTVAKYREELNVLSSSKRMHLYKLNKGPYSIS